MFLCLIHVSNDASQLEEDWSREQEALCRAEDEAAAAVAAAKVAEARAVAAESALAALRGPRQTVATQTTQSGDNNSNSNNGDSDMHASGDGVRNRFGWKSPVTGPGNGTTWSEKFRLSLENDDTSTNDGGGAETSMSLQEKWDLLKIATTPRYEGGGDGGEWGDPGEQDQDHSRERRVSLPEPR